MRNNKKLTNWKYQLHFDLRGAYEAGAKDHPQIEMKKFIEKMKEEKIIVEILDQEAVSIGDCWLFLVKCSTPWLGKRLPEYITHQGFGNDQEGIYE